ncbi:MAG TPA: DUF2511 domain-containing protein [Vicinamibacterales bacterium]|jgi:hypothetical protein|nr:DUF2511 domain-containing protein [Vicinamibacterales bacterium]
MPARQQRAVSRFDFPDEWPFVAGEGTLACQGGAVAFRAGNSTYALNEPARARGYASVEPLRLTQSAAPSNPLRRLRQEERTHIFAELASCKTAGSAPECRRRVADRYGLAPDEAQQIDVEGNERRWPPLTPQLMSVQKVLEAGLALCRD